VLTHVGTQRIETERLLLRRFVYEDNASMRRNWIADDEVQSGYCEPSYKTEESVHELLVKYITSYERDDYYRWAVIDKETSECIGQVAYFLVDSKNHFAEIEYCIGQAFQRRGFATEATKALIQYGFEKMNLHKIQICCRPVNQKSLGVIAKCGFVYEGELRDYFWLGDHYEGRRFFSILRDEYFRN